MIGMNLIWNWYFLVISGREWFVGFSRGGGLLIVRFVSGNVIGRW